MEFNLPQIEEKVLKYWKKNKVFEKSIERRPKSRRFVFYEGPPTANGRPGIHHVLARVFKDIMCRYKTMQGFRVERKAGWDTHGLPVELEVEKKLSIKSKPEIEQYGIEEFNKECKSSVWVYKEEWEKLTDRIGFWVDLKHPYITYENNYVDTLWWIVKQIWDKGLLYQDYKVLPYCPRCGTGLSSHEVAQGYKSVEEKSVYVRFKVLSKETEWKNTSILSWTTTPWTLPGNVALAISPKIDYIRVQDPYESGSWIVLALVNFKKLLEKNIFSTEYKQRFSVPQTRWKDVRIFKGSKLVGIQYEPLFVVSQLRTSQSYRVYPADFVTTEEGTGVVHTAVMYGEEDYELGKKIGLPKFHTVNSDGKFIKTLGEGLAGLFVKNLETEKLLIDSLKKKDLLFAQELYRHEYPFCWRCGSALLYYARESWFMNMQKVKKQLIVNNQTIHWIPAHLKKGRFGEWLREIKDWAISRERYWGTPLPIWECKKCSKRICLGSIKELEQKSKTKIKDVHRPFIDEVTFPCVSCGGKMKRILEVMDCWFDSGSMPYAQYHYPFENKELVDKRQQFPADYICEAIDQTRGWFYTLLAVSTLLGFGAPYKNVISLGHVLDAKGEKMSKSKGNIVDPWQMIQRYGAESVRWYFYTVNQPGESKLFSEKEMVSTLQRFFMIMWNCLVFFETYVSKKQMLNQKSKISSIKSRNILDKWIISRTQGLIRDTMKSLNQYDITAAARSLEDFAVNDLSQWYVRRSRRRFQRPETQKIKDEAARTLAYVLANFAKLIAPFTPFFAEELHQSLIKGESVHLLSYPIFEKRFVDGKLEKDMEQVREIIKKVLAKRAEAGIKVRQPLAKLELPKTASIPKILLELIQEEVNVKEVVLGRGKDVRLDTVVTKELRAEGLIREVIRHIQELRKQNGLRSKDKISVWYTGTSELERIIETNQQVVKKEIGAKNLQKGSEAEVGGQVQFGQEKLAVIIKKI